MKSTGAPSSLWCSHWKNVCCPSVPGMPQMIGAVGTPTAVPSPATRLPSDSISNCCRYVPRCRKRAREAAMFREL
ncbi:hypothetical protein G6F32_016196 [Rhizopus arrhizus]|nr:hypothetical protein G6F32_016196 [Rhizopus arrhizus]